MRLDDGSGESLDAALSALLPVAPEGAGGGGCASRARRGARRLPRPRMVHPAFKTVAEGALLPTQLTPVYPTTATLPRPVCVAIASALAHAPLAEILPADAAARPADAARRRAADAAPPPPTLALAAIEDLSHPAWQRLVLDELLAQRSPAALRRARRAVARAGCSPPCRLR